MDTTTTWYQFVDSLRRKLARRKWKEHSDNYRPHVNNLKTDDVSISINDYAMVEYYLNNVRMKGWDVEPALWKALNDTQRQIIIQLRKEAKMKQERNLQSPFVKNTKPSTTPQNYGNFKEVSTILPIPKDGNSIKTTDKRNADQQKNNLPHQYSNKNATTTSSHSGEKDEDDPDPSTILAYMSNLYN